jgi:hypothetical protein
MLDIGTRILARETWATEFTQPATVVDSRHCSPGFYNVLPDGSHRVVMMHECNFVEA